MKPPLLRGGRFSNSPLRRTGERKVRFFGRSMRKLEVGMRQKAEKFVRTAGRFIAKKFRRQALPPELLVTFESPDLGRSAERAPTTKDAHPDKRCKAERHQAQERRFGHRYRAADKSDSGGLVSHQGEPDNLTKVVNAIDRGLDGPRIIKRPKNAAAVDKSLRIA